MTEYRKIHGKDTWHFMKTCWHWPGNSYDSVRLPEGKRPHGELCNECQAKEKAPKKRKRKE